jgi:hypothetical protein
LNGHNIARFLVGAACLAAALSVYKWLALMNDVGFGLDQMKVFERYYETGMSGNRARREEIVAELKGYFPAGSRLPDSSMVGKIVESNRRIVIDALSRRDKKEE